MLGVAYVIIVSTLNLGWSDQTSTEHSTNRCHTLIHHEVTDNPDTKYEDATPPYHPLLPW